MRRALLIVMTIIVAAVNAHADETFYATLVPQPGTGSTAGGNATLVLNADATAITYTINVTGLSSPEQAAHIHRSNGSIAHTLPLGSNKTGTWFNPGFIDVTSLRLGQLFILVHTDDFPGGEVRGNITDEQVATEVTTWGKIKALY